MYARFTAPSIHGVGTGGNGTGCNQSRDRNKRAANEFRNAHLDDVMWTHVTMGHQLAVDHHVGGLHFDADDRRNGSDSGRRQRCTEPSDRGFDLIGSELTRLNRAAKLVRWTHHSSRRHVRQRNVEQNTKETKCK
jgi:hypothetical protein